MTSPVTAPAATVSASPRPPSPKRRAGPSGPYLVYLVPGLVLFVGVILLPFLMNLGISFTRWHGVGTPEWTGLDNYDRLFSDTTFWASFRNNLAVILAMAIIPTMIGLVLGAALFDYVAKRFGAGTASGLRASYYLPQVLPIPVAGIVWGWFLNPSYGALNASLEKLGLGGLAQDWLGDPSFALSSVMVVMVWIQIGFPVVIFMSGLQRVDPALYEAAEIDGASWWRRFWHVTIPQIRPEIYVVLLWTTIASLKVFAHIYVLTKGGPGGATNVPAYYSYQNFFEKTQVGYGAAIATALTVVIVVLTVLFLRVQDTGDEEAR
ncbi:carbohydrate ABC transporter permease [Micromonospora deserti]|uniref:Sugar ABC transporter permease n=1 Tax=Micromonospora deserti TaxID=2070366 RepID=A0A2W2DLS0_9ACTN|nr:sugar ABC transporter permease [Micromonospora deserti]PZG01790.1 sugar ABC transporter permease [Micromonospora deserti]